MAFVFSLLVSVPCLFSQEGPSSFSLKLLDPLLSEASLEAARRAWGQGEAARPLTDSLERIRFTVATGEGGGLPLSLWVQARGNSVVEFYAKFPSYLSAGLLHQALIDRYGKQERFFNKDGQSVYRWSDEGGKSITYSAQCSLTCFPLYLAVSPKTPPPDLPTFKSMLDALLEEE